MRLAVFNRNLGSELLISRLFACFATLIPQRGYHEALFFVLFIVDRSKKKFLISLHQIYSKPSWHCILELVEKKPFFG